MGDDSYADWLWVLAAGLAGLILSPITELLIARFVSRLGGVPALRVRITTAAVTCAICSAFALRVGITIELPALVFLSVLGVQLARTDAALHLLPNPLILSLLTGGFLLLLMSALFDSQAAGLLRGMAGSVILFASYLILALISPRSIGMGDVKLAAPIGLYLGYLGWTHLFLGGLLGFILNGMVTLIQVARQGRKNTVEVAHGPSMLAATAAVALLLV